MDNQDNSFLGSGWSFPPTFQVATGSVKMVAEAQDIKESLHILLQTAVGERIMQPEYGCNLQKYLFDSISTSKINFLKELVRTAILNFEPRIDLKEIEIDTSEYLEGVIKINLIYQIQSSNTRFNLVFPYYKIEGTNVPELFQEQITQTEIKSKK